MNLQYKLVVEQMLKEVLREDWMSDKDWNFLLDEVRDMSGITVESLVNDIETGVKNGHSVEKQIEILKSFFENRKNIR